MNARLEESSARSLRTEVEDGHAADRELARDLGRPEPRRATAPGGYVDTLGRRPALPAQLEHELVERAKAGDAQARAQLIEAYMPLIAGMARTYRSGQVQRQELLQEGAVGVLRALDGYDPDRGVPFWGYATWWVRQAMQQLVSELTRPAVLSDPDIGAFVELLVDPMADGEYERVLAAAEIDELHGLLAGLSERERPVLRARYGFEDDEERSLREIGDELGLSHERVRQIEKRALGKLAAAMHAD